MTNVEYQPYHVASSRAVTHKIRRNETTIASSPASYPEVLKQRLIGEKLAASPGAAPATDELSGRASDRRVARAIEGAARWERGALSCDLFLRLGAGLAEPCSGTPLRRSISMRLYFSVPRK